jgi:hypothetical protein
MSFGRANNTGPKKKNDVQEQFKIGNTLAGLLPAEVIDLQ